MGFVKNKPAYLGLNAVYTAVDFLDRRNMEDFTSEPDFLGQANRWLFEKCQNKEAGLVSGNYIGTRTLYDKPVLIDDLLSESYIDFDTKQIVRYLHTRR